jgi:ribosomal protein S18 acetylase RimI-like enzyme
MRLTAATTPAQFDAVRELFREYAEALGFDLCFQGFDQELAQLPGGYAPPKGRLYLATDDSGPAGCVALREFEPGVGEMKRLYVRPGYRRRGIGRMLTEQVIADARSSGYRTVRLDTVPRMKEAIALYESLGFRDIEPYRPNPIPGARYMELDLAPVRGGVKR